VPGNNCGDGAGFARSHKISSTFCMNHQTHFDPEIAEDKTAAKLPRGSSI